MRRFKGIIPAVLTPFDNKDRVNTGALTRVIDRLIQEGVGGLFVCGSTGEWMMMSPQERMLVAETAVAAARGRVKVMVHAGANSTRDAIALARHAEKIGADAISALPPTALKYKEDQIWGHFKAIADSTSLPLYLYHLPQVYGDVITVNKFIDALDEIPTLAGVKFSSYRIDDMIWLKIQAKGRLNIISGCGEQLLSATVCGADGSICTWFNFIPRLGNAIIDCARKGEIERARKLQDLVVEFGMLCIGTTYGSLKLLMRHRGYDVGHPRRPNPDPTPAEARRILRGCERMGIFKWSV